MSFTVDPETSAVVKEIFRLCLDGMMISDIARLMQERGEINPMDYKKKEIHHTVPPLPTAWVPDSIRNILRTELYTGTGTKNSKGQKILIFAEPLVSQEEFKAVQERIKVKRSGPVGYEENAFYRRVRVGGSEALVKKQGGELFFQKETTAVSYSAVEQAVKTALEKEIRDVQIAMAKMKAGCVEALEAAKEPLREKAWEIFRAMQEAEGEELEILNSEFTVLTKESRELERVFSLTNPWIVLYREMEMPERIDFPFVQKWIRRIDLEDGIAVLFHKQEWKEQLPAAWFEGD